MKSVITISRFWHSPKITTTISNESIKLKMDLEDFVTALKEEVGSVTWTFRKETFEKQLDEAVERTLKKIQQETNKVM